MTDWRNALRTRMNDLDTGAVAHAVDSLLNFETVKYFGAEEREARRYDNGDRAPMPRPRSRARTAWRWLNIGQALITNADARRRDGVRRLGLEPGTLHARATWCSSRPC